jgi:protochlorophyllide reductase
MLPLLRLSLLLFLQAAQVAAGGFDTKTIRAPKKVQAKTVETKAPSTNWVQKIRPPKKPPTLMDLRKITRGMKFGDKKIAVVTGASSGLGKKATKALLRSKKYHVIGAVRDLDKMSVVAEAEGFDMNNFTPMHLELASFDSVKNFAKELDKIRGDRPVDRLACNAAVYQPTLDYPKWTVDGHEQQLQINFLSQFLLTSLVMPMMEESEDARVCMIGSVTGNDNTVGGGGVYPIADLKELEGMELGCKNPIAMMDGYNFNGAKAYKDTKLALMMTSNMLHDRFHRSTDIAFSSIYPGCIAESPLFREKRAWFRKYFPIFMKYITGGFVGEEEAGQRLFQVLHDPRCTKSGVYWSWNGGAREGRGLEALEKGGQVIGAGGAGGGWDSIYENDQSDKVRNELLMQKLFQCATEITGAQWPKPYQPKCPTLDAVSQITSMLSEFEDGARTKAFRDQIVANHALPKEERRKYLEQMLLKHDKALTEADSALATAAAEMPKAKQEEEPLALPTGARSSQKKVGWLGRTAGWIARPGMTSWLINKARTTSKEASENVDVAEDAMRTHLPISKLAGAPSPSSSSSLERGSDAEALPKMIPGHELLGDVPVVFQPQNVMTMARVGHPLSEVASQADVLIDKADDVNIDGKWVPVSQAKITAVAPGQQVEVRSRTSSDVHKSSAPKEKATAGVALIEVAGACFRHLVPGLSALAFFMLAFVGLTKIRSFYGTVSSLREPFMIL